MSATYALLQLFGDIALLLWGIHMVHSGVLRAFGSDLRRLLGIGLKTRMRAFLAGLGVTAILQSSTATALMATSFAAGGIVDLVPALALMLGANVGTTLIVQVLSFDITLVFPVLILVGVIAFRRGGRTRTRDIGRVAIGLGLMLLALHLLVEAITPAETAPAVRALFTSITQDPILNLVAAAVLTWAAHSSVATMLVIMSLASAGIITPMASLAMVLGANLGSAVNPVVEGTAGDAVRLRLPVGNLFNRLIGCGIALPLLHPITSALAWVDPAPARMAANFHTAFNLVLAAAFMVPLPYIAKALKRLFPEQLKAADPGKPQYLDPAALETPSVALANAAREVLRMADVVETMLRGSQDVLHTGDRKHVAEIGRMDDILDKLHEAVERYLIQISHDGLSDEESRRLSDILAFSINLEHIGDIIEKNLMELAAKRIKKRLSFSSEGLAELDQMHDRLLDHLQLAVAVFMVGDVQAARRLVQEKEHFRDLERTATERHFERVREGRPESIETSGLHVDIIRDLKRIDSHIAATAYPLLEQSEMLRRSRLV